MATPQFLHQPPFPSQVPPLSPPPPFLAKHFKHLHVIQFLEVPKGSNYVYPWAILHFIWNVEFNTLQDLWHVSLPMIWGTWAKFLWLAPIPQIHKNMYKLTLRWPLNLSRASFDVKCVVYTLNDFCVLMMPMIWNIWVQFPWLAPLPQIY